MAPRHYQHDLFCAFSTQAVVSSSHYNPSVLCCNGGTFFVVPETADSLRFQNIIVKRVCLECNIPQRTEIADRVLCGRTLRKIQHMLLTLPTGLLFLGQ